MVDILNKIWIALKIIKQNGWITGSVKTLFYTDALKLGQFVGEDGYGNKYYENSYYFFGRDRWVHYNPKVGFNYDASQIPAEWYGWMHHITDLVPCNDRSRPHYRWMSNHTPNYSGTPLQYVPYSTVKEKLHTWDPKIARMIIPTSKKKTPKK